MTEFIFDEWTELYKNNPVEFENKRRELLAAEIMKVPVEHRNNLRILQLECDMIRLANNPLDATIEFTKMMQDRANRLATSLDELRSICEDIDK
jgi:hypothetical protein